MSQQNDVSVTAASDLTMTATDGAVSINAETGISFETTGGAISMASSTPYAAACASAVGETACVGEVQSDGVTAACVFNAQVAARCTATHIDWCSTISDESS